MIDLCFIIVNSFRYIKLSEKPLDYWQVRLYEKYSGKLMSYLCRTCFIVLWLNWSLCLYSEHDLLMPELPFVCYPALCGNTSATYLSLNVLSCLAPLQHQCP